MEGIELQWREPWYEVEKQADGDSDMLDVTAERIFIETTSITREATVYGAQKGQVSYGLTGEHAGSVGGSARRDVSELLVLESGSWRWSNEGRRLRLAVPEVAAVEEVAVGTRAHKSGKLGDPQQWRRWGRVVRGLLFSTTIQSWSHFVGGANDEDKLCFQELCYQEHVQECALRAMAELTHGQQVHKEVAQRQGGRQGGRQRREARAARQRQVESSVHRLARQREAVAQAERRAAAAAERRAQRFVERCRGLGIEVAAANSGEAALEVRARAAAARRETAARRATAWLEQKRSLDRAVPVG